jgi:diguanylate cyclase (GGDEF)-like protein
MKDGASDYLLKDRLARLGPAVTHALERKQLTEEKKAVEERLFYETFHDALTGLPNRALFLERLERTLLRGKRDKTYVFAVLLLYLEGFAVINDGLGPSVGDQLLIEVSQRLTRHVRSIDSVARLGSNEFLVLLDDLKIDTNSSRVATRIQQEVALPFTVNGREVFLTASIGITASTTGYDQAEEMLRDAGAAMFRAKEMGKGSFSMFDSTMHAHALERLKLEADLRRALEREEFLLQYQPIISLKTGRIAGFEALLRWRHPDHGLISPSDYIHVAEDTGLILPIGRWAILQACQQLHNWRRHKTAWAKITMSVNLSSRQFNDPDLLPFIARVLKDTALSGEALKLEITESVMMENIESAAALLRKLKAHHIRTCIDDFGMGYSSLSYIQQLPIDYLKIDQSFIARIGDDAKTMEIIHTIISLAHTLKTKVIAEGVETAEQIACLKAWKCQYGQGYYFAKPLLVEEATEFLVMDHRWRMRKQGDLGVSEDR